MNTHFKSILKAITWRLLGTWDTLIISYIVTGKLSLAGSIAGIEFFTKIFLFYLHDRVWEYGTN